MQSDWTDDSPIYKQLKNKVLGLILQGSYPEGEALPSVRHVSAQLSINHLTVAKAYQELVDDELIEKKRGLGMFVIPGAKEKIMKLEKQKFLSIELPAFIERMKQLELSLEDVDKLIKDFKEPSL